MAVDDDLLLKNPFGFQLDTVVVNDSVKREVVTPQQEQAFLDFIKEDLYYYKYYDAVLILKIIESLWLISFSKQEI